MADADPVRALKPRPQLTQLAVGSGVDLRTQGAGERSKAARHMVVLRPWRRVAEIAKPSTDLRHIGRADAEPGRNLHQRQIRAGQYSVTKILPVSLPTPPRHARLRHQTESFESHNQPVSKALFVIPVRAIPV